MPSVASYVNVPIWGPAPDRDVDQERIYTHWMPEPGTQMCIRVRLFASYREAAGAARLEMAVPAGATVGELVELLAVRLPALRTAPGLVAVNYDYVGPDFALHDGDEAAFIPPVSGGRD